MYMQIFLKNYYGTLKIFTEICRNEVGMEINGIKLSITLENILKKWKTFFNTIKPNKNVLKIKRKSLRKRYQKIMETERRFKKKLIEKTSETKKEISGQLIEFKKFVSTFRINR